MALAEQGARETPEIDATGPQTTVIRLELELDGETLGEEIASSLVHIIAAVLAAAALALLVVLASHTGSARAVVACAIYGATVFLTFLFSGIYHATFHRRTKAAFLLLDHCAIFLLIAGTYTPVTLIVLPETLGWSLFGVYWGLALLGVAARIWIGHLHWVLIPIFVAMGWLGFFWAGTLFSALGVGASWLLVAGSLAYTFGLVFFVWRSLPYNHAIWHFFVLAGAACHFLVIAMYVFELRETPLLAHVPAAIPPLIPGGSVG